MAIQTVGIISPGDMGHVVAQVLQQHGLRVVTCLHERSGRTRCLSQKVGLIEIDTYEMLVQEADIILSILVPSEAEKAARRIGDALHATGSHLLYADCNAISPQTAQRIESLIEAAGGRFVDASIIGPPPRKAGSTRIYAAGPNAQEFAQLNQYGLHVIPISERSGDASALKMCYGALTKGLIALSTQLLVAAQALGVADALAVELGQSQPEQLARMQSSLTNMPPKARRWVGEMEEIANTFDVVGMTPLLLLGAADIYRFVGETSLANRNPEDPDQPTLAQMVKALADHLR